MKYESNILERLIKTYGVVGNPKYVSEIIKQFIIQGKECYPNLFTYQSDWLAHIDEFGLKPTYTVGYTGQSIYAPNTLERPVKSAILSGSTKYRDIDTGEFLETFEEGRNLELVSVKMPVLTTTGKNLFYSTLEYGDFNNSTGIPNNTSPTIIRTKEYNEISSNKTYCITVFNALTRLSAFVVHEYDNDFNYIKSTNSNVFTTSANTKYVKFRFRKYDSSSYTEEELVALSCMITEGNTIPNTYEPFKSNILTVNEDVELRGIGDVRDTLDLMTGEVVERIGEIIIDENSNIVFPSYCENVDEGYFKFATDYIEQPKNNNYISNKLQKINVYELTNAVGFILVGGNGKFRYLFCIKSSELSELSLNGCKQWLAKNPITIQYQLATESIKTVDLTILDQNGQNVKQLMSFNGGTHFNTGSLEGSLIPSVSVGVETDLEETLKVCSLEGNTM